MSDHTPAEPTELSSGDADATNGGAPTEETVGTPKPRRRSPTKARQTKATRAAKGDKQTRGRTTRAKAAPAKTTPAAESGVRWVTVYASDLLEQLGELTEQLTRARVALETAGDERDALTADLERERSERSESERREKTKESALTEADEQLARARATTEELEAALEEARGQTDELRRLLLNFGRTPPRAPGSEASAPQGERRAWRRRR